MKVAIIGSRNLQIENLQNYLPKDVTTIISGGAKGIDSCARDYANSQHLQLIEFLPDYASFGRNAPLKRNITIIEQSDQVIAFWDGKSRGTKYVIDQCKKRNIPVEIHIL